MFGFLTITAILETLMLMPGLYTLLQFILTPSLAFLISCLFSLVTLTAIFITRLKPGPFIYKLITLAISVIIGLVAAGFSLGGFLVSVICFIIFSRVRTDMTTGRDAALQTSTAAIILNIPLAIFFWSTNLKAVASLGNTAILISTVAAVIVLVIKQADDSRRFGKNSMSISNTQRKNNQLFAGIMLLVLLAVSSIGHVTTIYAFVFSLIGKFFSLIANLLSTGKSNSPIPGQQEELVIEKGPENTSLFEEVLLKIINILAIILLVALVVFLTYKLVKFIIKLIIKFINWLRSGDSIIDMVTENGHTDEKQSLISRNFKNMIHRLQDIATGVFNREVPYSKLPDDISKVRRLFKYFIVGLKKSGVRAADSSTAQELCRDAGGIAPETGQFNALLAECYDSARYNDTAPTPQQLRQLEEKLLK